MHVVDLIIFLAYTGGIVLYGMSFYIKKRSSSEFVSGGGRIPSWAIGMSIFATFVSPCFLLILFHRNLFVCILSGSARVVAR